MHAGQPNTICANSAFNDDITYSSGALLCTSAYGFGAAVAVGTVCWWVRPLPISLTKEPVFVPAATEQQPVFVSGLRAHRTAGVPKRTTDAGNDLYRLVCRASAGRVQRLERIV